MAISMLRLEQTSLLPASAFVASSELRVIPNPQSGKCNQSADTCNRGEKNRLEYICSQPKLY